MISFEKYHPLLSAHYTLDWLTNANLKAVHELRANATQAELSGRKTDLDIPATAHYINQSMRLVMKNKALLYGITDRATQKFVGSICLWQFDADFTRAQMRLEVADAKNADALYQEIIPRVVGFSFFELGLAQLTMIVPENADLLQWLSANHFQSQPYPHTRKLASGQKVALLAMTLNRDTVADDPAYRF
ncbi:N-acetyltransferase [Lacticaseibacillus sp. N501-2]|uniref:N-acetyltransferase n=1 Tax=Lacticaseibacillus salsurae TaxID=3367729 RepID=UPI0038B264EE